MGLYLNLILSHWTQLKLITIPWDSKMSKMDLIIRQSHWAKEKKRVQSRASNPGFTVLRNNENFFYFPLQIFFFWFKLSLINRIYLYKRK